MNELGLKPAGLAFDAIAGSFDHRFGDWLSVAAQRDAVYRELLAAFPAGSRLIEIGGGTGIDAARLRGWGRTVHHTDASPAMVTQAQAKLGAGHAELCAAEDLDRLADRGERFDGAFSNFAGLNCVDDLTATGAALARLVRPGGKAVLVLFGCCCPMEWAVEGVHGRFGAMFRRFRRGEVPARLSGRHFTVRYHRRRAIEAAMAPHFRLTHRRAIGLFVPPSAAEPWISRHPRLLAGLTWLDRRLSRPAARFGDHILHVFERHETRPE